jgi:ABC-2 type transport system permease protein
VLTHLNPMTYAVEPLRSVVFDQLHVDLATRATFDPGIVWNHWQVPIGVQVILVVIVSVGFLAAAVARFARTE